MKTDSRNYAKYFLFLRNVLEVAFQNFLVQLSKFSFWVTNWGPEFKDSYRKELASSNETTALTKSMNMDIWMVGTSN